MDDMLRLVHIQSASVLAQYNTNTAALFGDRNFIIALKITCLRLLSWARWIQCAPSRPVSQLCTQCINIIIQCACVLISVCPASISDSVRRHFGSLAIRKQTFMKQSSGLHNFAPRAHKFRLIILIPIIRFVLLQNWQLFIISNGIKPCSQAATVQSSFITAKEQ